MQHEDPIWNLMARYLNDEVSDDERVQLQQLLRDDWAVYQQFELLQRFWGKQAINTTPEIQSEDPDKQSVQRILRLAENSSDCSEGGEQNLQDITSNPRKARTRIILYSSVAAAACALFFIIKYGYWNSEKINAGKEPQLQTIAAHNGTRTRTILPDGSVVWLNAGSTIAYVGDFKGAYREVTLEGEAYFDVVKNPAKPFIVHASQINIKVLGTAFNVKSYATDKNIETTLIHGLVQISSAKGPAGKVVYLHPNEKIIIPKQSDNITSGNLSSKVVAPEGLTIYKLDTAVNVQDRIETSWVYNRLIFHGDNFKELAAKMERWYNIQIVFTDNKVAQLNFNGSFKNETVEEAFTALQAAVPFTFKINEHEVYVSSSK